MENVEAFVGVVNNKSARMMQHQSVQMFTYRSEKDLDNDKAQ